MDVLTDILARSRARGAVFAHSTLRAPWGVEFRDDAPVSVHTVVEGELVLEHDAVGEPMRMLQGDLLLLHSPATYRFVHEQGARAVGLDDLAAARVAGHERRFVLGGDGDQTVLVCGAYTFHGAVSDGLLGSLPPVMLLRATRLDPALRSALALFDDEVVRDGPGQQAVLDRLLDLILVYGLRTWFAQAGEHAPPWFPAMADPAVGPALGAIHADPARPWTVEALARRAGLSRAAFARRFSTLVGEPPLAYLTGWRMRLAADALLAPGATVASTARQVGYANEFAFAAAFKRHHGAPPGRWRRGRLAA